MPDADPKITIHYAETLMKGVVKGFGKDFPKIDWDSPDYEMLKSLQQNVYQFSAAKNYQQLKSLSQALVGDDGKLRSWKDFKAAAYAINDEHNNHWLRAEYELAVNSSQMAGKWVRFQDDKDALPLLQFDAVDDERTTALCRSLDGVIKPIGDEFWNRYYPPNHYGCRSTVRQLADGVITPDEKIVHPEKMHDMFKTNLAKNGLAFPADHPYWIGTPEDVKKQALGLIPYEQQFAVVAKEGKGLLREHLQVDQTAPDYSTVRQIAAEKAAKGHKVDILPTLHENDPARQIIFADAKPRKNADLRIDGKLWEVEEPSKIRFQTIKNSISSASRQADYVTIKLSEHVDYMILKRLCKGRFIDHKELLVIEFFMAGAFYVFNRKNLLK